MYNNYDRVASGEFETKLVRELTTRDDVGDTSGTKAFFFFSLNLLIVNNVCHFGIKINWDISCKL